MADLYPADAVAQILAGSITLPSPPGGADVVLTYGSGGNLRVGPVRPVGDNVPQLCVFVVQSGGPPPVPYMGTSGESFRVSRVQVTVRSSINAFAQGEALARALQKRAFLNTPPGFTYCLAVDAEPLYLGTDDENSHRFAFNLDLGHRR